MKGLILSALALVTASSVPAHAYTEIHYSNDYWQIPIRKFFPTAGNLTKVTLEVEMEKTRDWTISVPSSLNQMSRLVSWSVNDIAQVRVLGYVLYFPLQNSGSSLVSLLNDGENATGTFGVISRGTGIFDLDPKKFVGVNQDYVIDSTDYGYLNPAGTTVTTQGPATLTNKWKFCNGQERQEDFCGYSVFKVTYEYDVPGVTPAVPEPATWAMMVLGFGVVGYAMRRRKVRYSQA